MIASPDPRRTGVPRLHVVTDDAVLRDGRFRETVEALLSAGGKRVALQLRGHRTSGRTLSEHAMACAHIAAATGSTLLVNDRVDVALACGANGVQLGRRSLPPSDARALLGPAGLIGVSVHTVKEADTATAEGADFLVAGTLYPSGTHPDRPASGIAWLRDLSSLGLPVIGIGGIDPSLVGEVLGAGAHGVAVIRGIWSADSPVAALTTYLERISGS